MRNLSPNDVAQITAAALTHFDLKCSWALSLAHVSQEKEPQIHPPLCDPVAIDVGFRGESHVNEVS